MPTAQELKEEAERNAKEEEEEEEEEEDAENDRDAAGEGTRGEVDKLRDSLGEFRV